MKRIKKATKEMKRKEIFYSCADFLEMVVRF